MAKNTHIMDKSFPAQKEMIRVEIANGNLHNAMQICKKNLADPRYNKHQCSVFQYNLGVINFAIGNYETAGYYFLLAQSNGFVDGIVNWLQRCQFEINRNS